jgi:RNA binding exosome subunit
MKQGKTRLLHHVTVSVFCKPHEVKEEVLHGLDQLSPVPTKVLLAQDPIYDGERPHTIYYRVPDVELTVQQTSTDEGAMIIYTLFFKKMHDVNVFMRQLLDAMTPEELAEFQANPALLLDFEGKLSCRLDKELLMQEKWSLTEDGHCYQIKAAVAAYPKNLENVQAVLSQVLHKAL